jgi:polar amino acid transport system substrate-binding protein
MGRMVRVVLALTLVLTVTVLGGCAKSEEPLRSPVVESPAIGTAGVLRAGVDLSTAPYGGVDGGREAGIDVDVAAALADRLGLELEIVDVSPSAAATALAEAKVDIVFSVPFIETSAAGLLSAGTYTSSAPAFFTAREGTASVEPVTLDSLSVEQVAAQTGSPAYWALRYELGESGVVAFDSLRAALQAVASGEVELAAGDALVGAYLARDITGIAFAGQLAGAEPLAVVTSEGNVDLADVVRKTLDDLAADGVLDTIRTKWVGDLPVLEGVESE